MRQTTVIDFADQATSLPEGILLSNHAQQRAEELQRERSLMDDIFERNIELRGQLATLAC
jgi:hypothetical protein